MYSPVMDLPSLIHLAGGLRGCDKLFSASPLTSFVINVLYSSESSGELLKYARVILTPLDGAYDYDSGHVILIYMEV